MAVKIAYPFILVNAGPSGNHVLGNYQTEKDALRNAPQFLADLEECHRGTSALSRAQNLVLFEAKMVVFMKDQPIETETVEK